jgi:hypothetical protein
VYATPSWQDGIVVRFKVPHDGFGNCKDGFWTPGDPKFFTFLRQCPNLQRMLITFMDPHHLEREYRDGEAGDFKINKLVTSMGLSRFLEIPHLQQLEIKASSCHYLVANSTTCRATTGELIKQLGGWYEAKAFKEVQMCIKHHRWCVDDCYQRGLKC